MHIQFWCVAAVVTVFFIVTCNESHMCCQHCDVYVSNNHCCTFLSSLLSPPSLLVYLLPLSPLAILPHGFCRFCFWLFILPRIQSAEFYVLWSHSPRHLCSFLWFDSSVTKLSFWRRQRVAVAITKLPRGDRGLQRDRSVWWQKKWGGGKARDTALSCGESLPWWPITLWTLLLLLQQDVSSKDAATWCDYFQVPSKPRNVTVLAWN